MQGDRDSGSHGALVMLAVFGLLGFALFHFYHDIIVRTLFMIKLEELKLISLLAPKYSQLEVFLETANVHQITFDQMQMITHDVGIIIQLPVFVLMGILILLLILFHPGERYKQAHSMDGLTKSLNHNFATNNIVEGVDLVKADMDKGPWAMAQSPVAFSRAHKLLMKKNGSYMIDENRARVLFRKQLGRTWNSISSLLVAEKFILAVLLSYIHHDRETGDRLLDQICLSVTQEKLKTGQLDYGNYAEVLSKHKDSPVLKEVLSHHGYVYTVFIQLLELARETGIVANANLLWLKPYHRQFWYTLNNVGRKAVFVESSAPHAHWLAEKEVGYALKVPVVDEAVSGLKASIENRIITEKTL